jgi:hypothetical protein
MHVQNAQGTKFARRGLYLTIKESFFCTHFDLPLLERWRSFSNEGMTKLLILRTKSPLPSCSPDS